jgi:hypothetical protein
MKVLVGFKIRPLKLRKKIILEAIKYEHDRTLKPVKTDDSSFCWELGPDISSLG